MRILSHGQIHESEEYEDVVIRFNTTRGSFPIIVVNEGTISTAENIGQQILEKFDYFIESEVYNAALRAGQ